MMVKEANQLINNCFYVDWSLPVQSTLQRLNHPIILNRTHLKNSLTPEWLCCRPAQKPHILPCMLLFFATLRLALGRDPYF